MVSSRRWSRLPVFLGVAVLWSGQWHVQVESRDDSSGIDARVCRSNCDGIEPQDAPITDAFRGLADAESARRRGVEAINPEAIAAFNLQRFTGLFAIAVVDREYGLRWIQTRLHTSLSIADIQAAEQACDVLLRRPIEPFPAVLDRRELRAGEPGSIIAVPVRDRDRVVSFVVGLLSDDFDPAMFGDAVAVTHP